MRILVITGNHPRHRVFVNAVEQYCQPSAYIICQREAMVPLPPEDLDEYLQHLWRLHFRKRDEAEEEFFKGRLDNRLNAPVLEVPSGQLNEDYVVDFVLKYGRFDLALISGVEIIKDPLFGLLPEYKVNAHLGLIPHFKGTMSPFWTHYLLRPHWNGCTYHVIAERVDTGMILHQTCAELVRGDGVHDAACRNYILMCDDVGKVIKAVQHRLEYNVPLSPDASLARRGKLFTKADWHAGMLEVVYGLYQDRIVDAYLDWYLPQSEGPKLTRLG